MGPPMFIIVGLVMGVFLTGLCCLIYLIINYLNWLIRCYFCRESIQIIIRELQSLRQHLPLKEFATLNLHIVSKYPLFDKEPIWEIIMNDPINPAIVNTKILNLIFIVESRKPFESILGSCHTILSKGRVVTHTMKQMFYHMYYSSPEYTEPDAVILYNNSQMLENEHDAIHSEISFRNMTAGKNPVLALFDTTKEKLNQGVRAVESASPGLHVADYKVTPMSRFHYTFIQKVEC